MSFRDEPLRRLNEYAKRNGLTLGRELGFGVHGIVYAAKGQSTEGLASMPTAIKALEREAEYLRERDAYLRLLENNIRSIRQCTVPQLLYFADDLWILEMTIVSPPFVLDFGGAYLENVPVFSDDVMADYLAEKREQFGEDWPEAQAILRILESYGIFVVDVNPNNIAVRPLPLIAK